MNLIARYASSPRLSSLSPGLSSRQIVAVTQSAAREVTMAMRDAVERGSGARMVGLIGVVAMLGALLTGPPISAQSPLADRVARDPEVQGAQRLFTAWGQMLYRHLPGVAIGVVADQDLVWAAGFGFADIAAKRPMTPQTKFRMASHSKLFTAASVMRLREQGSSNTSTRRSG
jgi:CubicO group peptidase (beta-lactamase class C family)